MQRIRQDSEYYLRYYAALCIVALLLLVPLGLFYEWFSGSFWASAWWMLWVFLVFLLAVALVWLFETYGLRNRPTLFGTILRTALIPNLFLCFLMIDSDWDAALFTLFYSVPITLLICAGAMLVKVKFMPRNPRRVLVSDGRAAGSQ